VLPLRPGAIGEAVRDLQQRLAGLGHDCGEDEPGTFAPGTERAVRAFQQVRGLRTDGICGRETWSALVEAGYRLGDRFLYLRRPMLRGDDVAVLQRKLGALGFDPGKVDGMFGPLTAGALTEFQRNVALTVDGICGSVTLQALDRLGSRCDGSLSVAAVRELETLRAAPRTLAGRRLVVGDGGGVGALAGAVARVLGRWGAVADVTHHPDPSEQAEEANAAGADAYLGFVLDPAADGVTTAYYAGHRYESPAGRRLAELVQELVPVTLDLKDGGTRGMALTVLLETRMPAVVCELGPAPVVVERTAELAEAFGAVLAAWATGGID
jgi:N-acetylmuramoyl-L-alanine amidase